MTHSCDILAGNIRKRITKRDKNYMGVSVGQTGSGKSATTSNICGMVDETFFDDCRVVFTPADFMTEIQTMDKGTSIMFDEAGVGIPAREWQRIQNRLMGYTAQLFRHKNLCVFFTVPSMSFIDMQLRILMHGIIDTRAIDYEQEISIAKYYVIKHDPVFNTIKYKLFEYTGSDGSPYALDPLCTPHPEEKFWKQYLKKKEDFAAKFYKETEEELKGISGDKVDTRELNKMQYKIKALGNAVDYLHDTQGMSWREIAKVTSVPATTLRDWFSSGRTASE